MLHLQKLRLLPLLQLCCWPWQQLCQSCAWHIPHHCAWLWLLLPLLRLLLVLLLLLKLLLLQKRLLWLLLSWLWSLLLRLLLWL